MPIILCILRRDRQHFPGSPVTDILLETHLQQRADVIVRLSEFGENQRRGRQTLKGLKYKRFRVSSLTLTLISPRKSKRFCVKATASIGSIFFSF